MKNQFTYFFKEPIETFWWRYEYPHKLNFGDEITPIIIKKIFHRRVVWRDPRECDVAAIGSILKGVSDRAGGHHVKIWGSGLIEDIPKASYNNLSFYAVRGKLTRNRISNIKDNVALGDPALLLPLAINQTHKPIYKIGIIPHYIDATSPKLNRFKDCPEVIIIDALSPPQKVIQQINSCELILSSSLHGLIVSDAYNVPNFWTPLSSNVYGAGFKFKDYYSVFNREAKPIDIDMVELKETSQLINSYESIQSILPKIQENLINAFPLI